MRFYQTKRKSENQFSPGYRSALLRYKKMKNVSTSAGDGQDRRMCMTFMTLSLDYPSYIWTSGGKKISFTRSRAERKSCQCRPAVQIGFWKDKKKHDHGTVGKEKPPDVDTRSGDVDLNVAMTTL